MPSGGARRGAGRKPKDLVELEVTGRFSPARHGHLLRPQFRVEPSRARWFPDPAALDGLSAEARGFAERTANEYEIDEHAAPLVMDAARALHRKAAFERVVDAEGVLVDGKPHPLLKPLAAERRAFLALLRQLDLER
jgi:hypothetical protein